MHVGYGRVSTREQTIDLQVDALTQAGCTTVYTEVISGARAERPSLAQVLEMLRAGDVLVIWKLDRLGRSLTHLLTIVTDLMTRRVGLKSLNDPIDTTTPQGRLIFNLFASLAEFEREAIRERTQAKPRHHFISAGGEFTRPCRVDTRSIGHQGRTCGGGGPPCIRVEGLKSAGLCGFNTVGFVPH
jgi:DNA invertase Pin-like site-specific DNA recombinase